jgi:hypothetical protein
VEAAQEADLVRIDVPGARHDALVLDGLVDRTFGVGDQSAQGLVGVPVLAQDVRPQVGERLPFLLGREQLEHTEAEADRDGVRRRQDRAHLVGGAPPGSARSQDLPFAVHAEVAVNGDPGIGPYQEVLPSGVHAIDDVPAEVGRGKSRDAEIRREQAATGERLVEAPGRDEDGVAFGHGG